VPSQPPFIKVHFKPKCHEFSKKLGNPVQQLDWPFHAGSLCQDQLGPGAWPDRYQAKASRLQHLLVARDVEGGIEMGDRLRRHAGNLAGLLAESAQRNPPFSSIGEKVGVIWCWLTPFSPCPLGGQLKTSA